MSTLSPDDFLLIGLKGSGKSNFLVALDVVLDSAVDPDSLTHSDLADDRAYLQPLKEKWLRGEQLGRTNRQETPPPHQLFVKHPPTGTTAGFHLPDLAGEHFDSNFETRSFSPEFKKRLKETKGIILFVHSEENADHAILDDPGLMDPAPATKAVAAPALAGTTAALPAAALKDWELKDAAPQTKLVDLLQFVAEVRRGLPALKVVVAISAWDRVEAGPKLKEIPRQPGAFLKARWPLLEQYLRSHPDKFVHRIFGISARGGGNSQADSDLLTAKAKPFERVMLVDEDHKSHDLTRPVRWLLGLLNQPVIPNV